jgi:hypothetical protein
MAQLLRNVRVPAAIVALALLLATVPHAAQPAKLRQLGGIDDLKAWFNASQGHPRVIFLLSPT